MRWVPLLLLCACDAGSREPAAAPVPFAPAPKPALEPAPAPAKPPTPAPPAPNPVTSVIPAQKIKELTGCWRHDASESWTFRPEGNDGLVVVRELKDTTYADRARIPNRVTYDPKADTYGFGAAGRIHGLLMMFQLDHATLKASVFSSHTRGEYHWTGNNVTLKRC